MAKDSFPRFTRTLVNGERMLFIVCWCAAGALVASVNAEEPTLARIQQILASKRMVDLTHAFEPGIPHWSGFPDEKRETIYWYEKGRGTLGEGFFSEVYTHVGQWGTHVDPPAHFIKGLRTVDQIELKEMILPLVVIDVHEEAAKNPDYTLTLDRVKQWEKEHGAVPAEAFVALRTDWSKSLSASSDAKISRRLDIGSDFLAVGEGDPVNSVLSVLADSVRSLGTSLASIWAGGLLISSFRREEGFAYCREVFGPAFFTELLSLIS